MSDKIKNIEQAIIELESIQNWGLKINKIKEIKEEIIEEKTRLDELINLILKDELNIKKKKKYNKLDFDLLVNNFKSTTSLDEKIELYQLINYYINETENRIFN